VRTLVYTVLLLVGCVTFMGRFAFATDRVDSSMNHYDGSRFLNPWVEEHGFSSFWKWATNRERGKWIEMPDIPPGPPPPERVMGDTLRVTFVNHATFLLQTGGVNILTDPIWSDRCSPVQWAGPKRFRPPGIRFEDLPPIDLVLISHNHYDHLDLPTLRMLAQRDDPKVIAPLNNAHIIARAGLRQVRELDWWEDVEVDTDGRRVRITCVPAQHFSARTPFDRNKSLWAGFVIDTASGPVYFAGDTGFGPFFQEIRDRFGPMRLSLLPIGAYLPRWFMGPQHIDPQQAVDVHRILEARLSIAMHYGTFPLADDGMEDPVRELSAALDDTREEMPPFRRMQEGEGVLVE